MNIQALNLAAFGPFTDRALVFGQQAGGLHIVYGPNEAGKSSALRGLKALLYGIEERTPDNFLHANEKLRINGCLRTADGHELAFGRRKGRKNTLLTPQGEVLDEQALTAFLQGVTPDLFKTLFGIDHQALVQGGQEILEQKGEVGQALFSAALGSHALHAVLAQLDDEADGLFRPRGSTQAINSGLKSYTELKKAIRDQSLSSREWDERRRALGRTTKALARTQSELADHRSEAIRLKRIQRVLPKLARRRELLRELQSMGAVVILADGFAERRQGALKGLETARAIAGKAMPRLQGLENQLNGLSISQELLDQAETIEDLHARMGGHRKALQDRPHLQAERQALLTDADLLLKEVRPDLELTDIEQLRPILARRLGITELGNKNAVLMSRVEQAASSRRETETRLKVARTERHELSDSDSSTALRKTIVAARRLGDVDSAIQSAQRDCAALQEQCVADLSRLPLWDGVLDDLPGLAVPNRPGIDRFEERYDALEQRCQRLREKQQEAGDALQDLLLRLDEIHRAGAVPTEADLLEARSDRDRVWRLLRRHWLDGEDASAQAPHFDAEPALLDTFEDRVADADELSDRLRREADRVHAVANLEATRESVRQQAAEITRQLEAWSADEGRIDAQWQALWAPCRIQPRTPREMRAWLNELEKLRERIGQLNLIRQKAGELKQTRQAHIQLLNQQVQALGKRPSKSEALETVLLECESLAQQLDEIKQTRDVLDKAINDLKIDLESSSNEHCLAMEEVEAWQGQWRQLLECHGLQGDTSPAEVADFIEKLRALLAKQSEAEKLRIRVRAIDDDTESFRGQVASMVASMAASIATELTDLSAHDAVMRLNSLLSENRSNKTQRRQIEQQIEQAQQEIQDSTATIRTMTERLDSYCVEAQCNRHTELEEAERRSVRCLEVKASIESIEKQILETGEGATVAELEVEGKSMDPDGLPGRIEELHIKIDDELEPKRTDLARARGREEKELELMDGSDHAAELADQAQAIGAGIRSDAERYVRVKLAGRVLRDEIERYRKANQGPLVKRASEHFAALTLGSFQRLMTDFNEKDAPVLAGIRPDGEQVTVEGMSSGTRDQLYLALRLASLEKYMETAEPMPFIVDDILVDFDDKRSQAALHALAGLAEKTQVIVFTHHTQVVEQARRLHAAAQVQVHALVTPRGAG